MGSSSVFIDHIKVFVRGGDGGNGCVSFRREKHVPRGGPNGGDGGKGGDVIFKGDNGLLTLLDLSYTPHIKAGRGRHGKGKDCNGRRGEDKIVKVPPGTSVTDVDNGEKLGEIYAHGQELIVAYGGKGGRGNKQFATSVNKAPREYENGKAGEERNLFVELNLIADVGLVGAPNAGKSTFINFVSGAKSKVAAYPFTTLNPVLGVLELDDDVRIIIADIPGLIRGAYKGKGLGDKFLKHIKHTKILVFILDMSDQATEDFLMLRQELQKYDKTLSRKPFLIAANKMDLKKSRDKLNDFKSEKEIRKIEIFPMSSLTGEGIDDLLSGIKRVLNEKNEIDQ